MGELVFCRGATDPYLMNPVAMLGSGSWLTTINC